jgi:hypothetical protein
MEHQPFSPDLALNDSWLHPKIKSSLKVQKFHVIEDIKKKKKKKVMMTLKAFPQQKFQECFQQWQNHWAK